MTALKIRSRAAAAMLAAILGGAGAAAPPAGPNPEAPGEPSEAPKPAGRAEADALKKEALAILKDLENSRPEPRVRAERSRLAISKLEEAKRILDGMSGTAAGETRGEVNALLYWARKMTPILVPQNPVPPPENPPEPAPSPPKADAEAREAEAELALMEANLYEERHASDLFMLSARYLEVADRYQGTRAGREAHGKVSALMRRTMEELQKAREQARAAEEQARKAEEEARKAREAALRPPVEPPGEPAPGTVEPPKGPKEPPGMISSLPGAEVETLPRPAEVAEGPITNRLGRTEATACLYRQKNPRLGADIHYLWLRIRFFDGEKPIRPAGFRLKAFLLQETDRGLVPSGSVSYPLTEDAWKNAEHDARWNCLSHQPALDASVFAKEGYAKRPVHANQGFLLVFIQHFSALDTASVPTWRARLEIWDSGGTTKRLETPPMTVRVLETTAQEKAATPPKEAEPPADGAAAAFRLGEEHLRAGRNDEAEKAYKQAILLFEKADGPESERIAACLARLGSVYGNRHQFPVAEQYIRKAYGMASRIFGPDSPKIIPCLENLEALMKATGRPADAKKVRDKISQIQAQSPEKAKH